MNIELVTIGNEVLSGYTVNTNAAFIGKKLFLAGYKLSHQTVLPDDPEALKIGISEALERSDLVITTGGLGPTLDDITRKVAADLFESDFHFDEEVAADLKKRFGGDFPTMEDQATVPSKAKLFLNTVGTAPGVIFQDEKRTLIMVPGVPVEMRPMISNQVIPYIIENFPLKKRPYRKIIHLTKLPELAVDPLLRELKEKYPEIDFGIYPAIGLLDVQLTSYSDNESDAFSQLEGPYNAIVEKFSDYIFESPSGTIEEAIQALLVEKNWTLGAAESCTGGSIAARLTQLPGASDYFLGSIVSYSNAVKIVTLGVPKETLKEHGAVSEEVVKAMVEGIFRVMDTDFAIAVSGIAGPTGATPTKPVGTVCFAMGRKGQEPTMWKIHARGDRSMVITRSVNELLSKLYHFARHEV